MLTILHTIVDSIFPPRPEELLVRTLPLRENKRWYQPDTRYGIRYLASYQDTVVQAAIIENKYHNNARAAQFLAELLKLELEQLPGKLVVIPIPLHPTRLRERGYNQVSVILKKLPISDKLEIRTDILKRIKMTAPQTTLPKAAREANLKAAFSCDENRVSQLEEVTVVVVDDVVTTGSTLNAARAELAPHLHPTSRLLCLALAH